MFAATMKANYFKNVVGYEKASRQARRFFIARKVFASSKSGPIIAVGGRPDGLLSISESGVKTMMNLSTSRVVFRIFPQTPDALGGAGMREYPIQVFAGVVPFPAFVRRARLERLSALAVETLHPFQRVGEQGGGFV
jgi:hypothetical protein